ncbi:MAG: aldo/keto reductase [Gammaproteobacteria bacterium]
MRGNGTIAPALRPLGSTGIRVSEIGCGCSSLGGILDREGETESLRTLQIALDRGVNFFDSADAYSMGRSEELLGRAIRGRRDRVVIATKGGSRFTPAWKTVVDSRSVLVPLRKVLKPFKRYFNLLRHTQKQYDYSPAHLRNALEASLRRLGTDYIDLYQLYNPTTPELRAGEFVATLERFKREGKIRFYGISCRSAEDALLCLNYPGVSSVQIVVSLADQDAIGTVIDRLADRDVGVIAREPLAQGLLTAGVGRKLADESARSLDEIRSRRLRAEEFTFLRRSGRSLAQAAIQFALQVPGVSTVIPGMVTPGELDENLGALGATPLDEHELRQIAAMAGGFA